MFEDLKKEAILPDLDENIKKIEQICGKTSDLLVNRFLCGNVKACLICCEGMFSTSTITELVLHPLTSVPESICDALSLFDYLQNKLLMSADRIEITNYSELFRTLNSGFAIIIADGISMALAYGVQGYDKRSINEPANERNILGSKDSFSEVVRTNMSLLRRRLKTPLFHMELFPLGEKSKTDICLCYMSDRVPKGLVARIKRDLNKIKLETILTSGYIKPFLESKRPHLFNSTGLTERPDVLCSKLIEGRVAVLIDGVPFGIYVPKMMIDSFQTLDDYCYKPFYASFVRLLKIAAFLIAIFLPAIYVSFGVHHPDQLNEILLNILNEGEKNAPFPLLAEALGVLLMYEIIKEAGLRLPDVIGSAVSIVGGLIIGDAAVSSGLISTPMLTIAAISVISGFAISDLAPQISILRLVFLIFGGLFGLFGVAAAATVVCFDICATEDYRYPLTAPLSPFDLYSMRDTAIRVGFRKLQKQNFTVESLKAKEDSE